MPELCRFYGIIIRMFFTDHGPPHFHARYAEHDASVDIESLEIVEGRLPPRARGLVREWASIHQDELREAWVRTRRRESAGKIAPLD